MIEAMVLINDEIWTVPVHHNFLVAINVHTGMTRYICQVSEEAQERLYGDIVNFNNEKLFIIPMSADDMAVYDLKSGSISHIKIEYPKKYDGNTSYRPSYKFSRGMQLQDFVYLFPCTFPGIVAVNPKTYEISINDAWVMEVEKNKQVDKEVYFRDCIFKDKKVYMASSCENAILEYDYIRDVVRVFYIGEKEYSTVVYDGEKFVAASKYGHRVIRIGEKMDEWEKLVDYKDNSPVISMHPSKNGLYVFPFKVEESYYLYKGDKYTLGLESGFIFNTLSDGSYIYIIDDRNGKLQRVSFNDGRVPPIVLKYDERIKRQLYKRFIDKKIMYEEELRLDEYIEMLGII